MYSLKNPHFYKLTNQIKKENIKLHQKALPNCISLLSSQKYVDF